MREGKNMADRRYSGVVWIGQKQVVRVLAVTLVFMLMAFPLVTTFNEILTRALERSGGYTYIAKYIVPFYTRSAAWTLGLVGVETRPTANYLFVQRGDGETAGMYFSWNCLGWQSGVLLVLTLMVGLTGKNGWEQKTETVLLGAAGTFLVNLLRIIVVVGVSYWWGELPARIVHDFGGTILTVGWFGVFWWFSYKFILVMVPSSVAIRDGMIDGNICRSGSGKNPRTS